MASDAFPLSLLIKGLLAIFATEVIVPLLFVHLPITGMVALGILRLIQSIVLLALVHLSNGVVDLHVIGLGRGTRARGWRWGLMGAVLFTLAALGGAAALYLFGLNPLRLIHTPLPGAAGQKALFFIVGGCIAPITEEVLFRGYLYTYCRRWGVPTALALSTAVFVALHLPTGLPITQVVGGVVFALAYEYSGSLIAAILIHSLGNLAIFSLSLF